MFNEFSVPSLLQQACIGGMGLYAMGIDMTQRIQRGFKACNECTFCLRSFCGSGYGGDCPQFR